MPVVLFLDCLILAVLPKVRPISTSPELFISPHIAHLPTSKSIKLKQPHSGKQGRKEQNTNPKNQLGGEYCKQELPAKAIELEKFSLLLYPFLSSA